jgi:DNA-directed RNA polymerase subunit L
MSALTVETCYKFIDQEHKLVLQADATLFYLTDIKKAKSFITSLERNRVTILTLDIEQLLSADSNVESFLYQIAHYFAKNAQSSFYIQADGDNEVQNQLIANLLLINRACNVAFTVD